MVIYTVTLLTDFEEQEIIYHFVTSKAEENFIKKPAFVYLERDIAKECLRAMANKETSFYCRDCLYIISNVKKYKGYQIHDPYYYQKVDFSKSNKPIRLYVYKNKAICQICERSRRERNIINVRATMLSISGNIIPNVNIEYCGNCKIFFIDSNSLNLYDDQYGILYCERKYSNKEYSLYGLNPDSILSRNGYKADGSMDMHARRRCLTFIIENGLATKYEVIDHLSMLIEMKGNRCHNALPIWEEDLWFVNNYDLYSQKYIGEVLILDNGIPPSADRSFRRG